MRGFGSPAHRLLSACAAWRPGRGTDSLASLFAGVADWEALRRLSRRHGLFPLVHAALEAAGPMSFDEGERERWRVLFREHALHNLALAGELISLLRHLEAEGVRCLSFKGPVLAQEAYGDLSLRPFADLDLLAGKDRLPDLARVLGTAGYLAEGPMRRVIDAAPRIPPALLPTEFHFARPREGFLVDVHLTPTPLEFDGLRGQAQAWAGARNITLAGALIPTISRGEAIIQLALHASKHFWNRLLWVADIDRMVAVGADDDWDGILAEARRRGCRRRLLLGLSLARDLLGTSLPDRIQAAVRADVHLPQLAGAALDAMGMDEADDRLTAGGLRIYWTMFERGRDRFRFAWRRAFMPRLEDFRAVDLPPALFFIHAGLRPWRLLFGDRTRSTEN